MRKIEELIKELLSGVEKMTELLYQNKVQEGFFVLSAFIEKLEKYCQKYPYQWYNFFNFWNI